MSFLNNIAHHWHVAREAYKAEKAQGKQEKMQSHEIEFMPAVLEVVDSPPNPLGRTIMFTICTAAVLAILWASLGEIDIIASSTGKIVSSGRSKVIQPLESGSVQAIWVRDGERVNQGDVLLELNPTDAEADLDRLAYEVMSSKLETSRLRALSTKDPLTALSIPSGTPNHLAVVQRQLLRQEWGEFLAKLDGMDNEMDSREAELKSIIAESNRLEKVLPIIREQVRSRQILVERGYSPRLQFLELQERLIEAEQNLLAEKHKANEVEATLQSLKERRKEMHASFKRDVLTRLSEAENTLQSKEQELRKARKRSGLMTLRAPVNGVVQQLAVHTVGGVVTPAQELMVIVPENQELEIEAKVLNKDIGFVLAGQEAAIKVEAFPFTKYGTLDGQVVTVSQDAVTDEQLGPIYPARIKMFDTVIATKDQKIPLSAGMSVQVEIKTGKRRLIEYLLAPLQTYADESLRER